MVGSAWEANSDQPHDQQSVIIHLTSLRLASKVTRTDQQKTMLIWNSGGWCDVAVRA